MRKAIHAALLVAGVALAVAAAATPDADPQQLTLVRAILFLGGACNLLGLFVARPALRPGIRTTATIVVLIFAAGAVWAALVIRADALPTTARDDAATRAWLFGRAQLLLWSAAALIQVALSLAALPAAARSATRPAARST
ncbi:MAG: hypothetical protein IPM64_01150 [Phycisphaerales bacterium]|nr:hypothetical protein [Phycisphaerales bacterium]